MFVRLTRKLADLLNGIDVSTFQVGEVINLPESDAKMLIAEGWAEAAPPEIVTASDRPARRKRR